MVEDRTMGGQLSYPKEHTATKCAIWARVSTGERDTGNQVAELRAWAARRGLEVAADRGVR